MYPQNGLIPQTTTDRQKEIECKVKPTVRSLVPLFLAKAVNLRLVKLFGVKVGKPNEIALERDYKYTEDKAGELWRTLNSIWSGLLDLGGLNLSVFHYQLM